MSYTEAERALIESRKQAHIDINLQKDVDAAQNYWGLMSFVHNALPEVNKDDVDLTTTFLGKDLALPLVISGMTGGSAQGKVINENLARAAAEVGVAMGVGSQRAGLADPTWHETFSVMGDYDVPLRIGNIGIPQFIEQGEKPAFGEDEVIAVRDMVRAHLIAVHLNYLQEVVQPEGDVAAKGCLEVLSELAPKFPLMVKETGAGISRQVALQVKKAGVQAIDVGGMSGTSFSAVEYYRAVEGGHKVQEELGKQLWSWGIPTPASVRMSQVGLPVVATGGLRTGMDLARALVLGANLGGFARRFLEAATRSPKAVIEVIDLIEEELRSTMFLLGAKNISEMKEQPLIYHGPLRDWMDYTDRVVA